MTKKSTAFIHVDDYGYTKSMSEKILYCIENGSVNSVSIMIDTESEVIETIKQQDSVLKKLHLNLTSLSEVRNVSNHEKLTRLTFFRLFFASKSIKEVCKKELNHQIEKFIEHFEYNNIELDGHHHIQAIPWIYKFLIDHKEIQIENIRIPSEKIVLLDFKCLFNLTFYRNLVAVLILKLLCLRKKRYAKKGFAGLLYSGIYNLNSLKKHLHKLNNFYSEFEITFHPGHPVESEHKVFKENHLKYVTSENRVREYELLQNKFLY